MRLTNTMRTAFVRAAMQDVPQVDYTEQIRTVAIDYAVAKLPPKIRAIWNDKDLRGHVGTSQIFVGGAYIAIPGDGMTEEERHTAFGSLIAMRKAQQTELDNLATKLTGVANSCATRKALADALPEFAKYLPPEETPINRSMPALANVVADFMKAGWPKGHKPNPAAAQPRKGARK